MIEVEKKCWITDKNKVIELLNKKAIFCKEIKKKDIYYIRRDDSLAKSLSLKDKIVRLRCSEGKSIVTFKEKTLKEGAEVNVEVEFEIDDKLAFKQFIKYLGLIKLVEKVKDVRLFSYNDISLEYVHIHNLGYFLEGEVMCESDVEVDNAIIKINKVFNEFDIQKEDFEDKMYIELLIEKNVKL